MILRSLLGKPRATIGRGSTAWMAQDFGQAATAGVKVTTESAMSYSAVFAAVRIMASTIGTLPWHIHERIGDDDSRIDRTDPRDFLLHRQPNDEMSSQSMREAMMVAAILTGNAYAEITRTRGGDIEAITPIPRHLAELQRDTTGELRLRVLPDRDNPTSGRNVPYRDVFHIKGIGDGLVGYFFLQLARESVGLGIATERFGATWFGNGSRAGGFLRHPGKLSDQSRKNLRESWERLHKGPDKAHRVGILEEGMDFVQNSIPPEAAQFLQTRTFQIQEISRFTGVPPHMLAELSRGTFSNIEHQSIEFVRYAALPWVKKWESEADIKLIARRERARVFTKMDLAGLLRGDKKSQAEFYRTMLNIGAMSVNEVRRKEDMNGIGPAGDRHYMQRNMATLDEINDPASVNAPATARIGATVDVERHKKAMARVFADVVERVVRKEARAATAASEKRKDAGVFAEWLTTFMDRQEEMVIESLRAPAAALAEAIAATVTPDLQRALDSIVEIYARDHIETSRRELTEAHANKTVGDLADLWLIHRPAQAATQLTDQIAQAALLSTQNTTAEKDTSNEYVPE